MSFDAFKAESNRGDTIEPPDGRHTATLVTGKVGASRAGDTMVILEWQTADFAHYWTSFHRTSGKASYFTRQVLDGLGLDVDEYDSWESVGTALGRLDGTAYTVMVQRNGDYLNTSVVGKPDHVQPELPVDSSDFQPKSSGLFDDDDDVPF